MKSSIGQKLVIWIMLTFVTTQTIYIVSLSLIKQRTFNRLERSSPKSIHEFPHQESIFKSAGENDLLRIKTLKG